MLNIARSGFIPAVARALRKGPRICKVRLALPLCAASIALVAAGCGTSSTNSSSSGSAVAAQAASTVTTAATTGGGSATSGGVATGAGATTKPGATLAVGETATVPFQNPDSLSQAAPPYKLRVTVVSITKAPFSDFNGIKLDASEKAGTPYYLRFKITNVGQGDLASMTGGAISGVDNTGQDASSVIFFGDFPPCENTAAPKPFTHGKTWSTCYVYLVPGGITAAHYNGFVQSYIESPVTWK
jgi:hypothetical protein